MPVLDAKGKAIRPGMAASDRFGIVYEVVSIESPGPGCIKPVAVVNGKTRTNKAGNELEVL